MYGTRDAAQNWQETLSGHLQGVGFKRGVMNPCIFHHEGRGIRTVVHGDDYTSVGSPVSLEWLRRVLEKKYELKTSVIGHEGGACTEGKVLNRIIRYTDKGIEYEADQRHAEIIAEQVGALENKVYRVPYEKPGEETK